MEDDKRQFQCLRKYEVIAKQFNELLITGMESARTRPLKRRKLSISSRAGTSTAPQRAQIDEGLVETITRFLRDLGANQESRDQDQTLNNQRI